MAFIDFPNLTNPFTQIDTYSSQVSGVPVPVTAGYYPNGAMNVPGGVYQMPVSVYSKYAGLSSTYAPAVTVLGTTSTSVNVASVNNTNELAVGMTVTGSGVAAGTTIAAIPTSTTITLSKATTTSVTLAQLTCFFGTNVYNGFPPILKYVRYLSQNNPALLAYPAGVYYADSTGTVVTGYANEAYGVTTNNAALNPNACAGVLLPSTASSGVTAAALNGNWCWIQVGGLCPGVAAVGSCVIGDSLSMSVTTTQAFTVVRTALGTANPYQNYLGVCMSNLSTNTTCDLLVNPVLAIS
jgi:hypothetical protein